MDLRQLEYFVAVANAQSFTRAAESLHVSQSTVSAGVKALEREVGVSLIIRTTRQFHLSPAGTEMLMRGQSLLADEQAALAAVRRADGVVSGRLRLGAPTFEPPFDLPDLLARFRQRYPAVELQLISSPTGSVGMRQDVIDNQLDAAFSSDPTPHPALSVREIARTPVVLVVADDHELATQSTVTLADIAEDPFIDFPAGFGLRAIADDAFRAVGLRRSVMVESSTAAMILAFVRNGLGIALLPESAVRQAPGVVTLGLRDAALHWSISLICHQRRWQPPALTALVELLDDAEAEDAGDGDSGKAAGHGDPSRAGRR
ncbi:LysR family transcriptional regulator [Brevibacterium sp. 2SA]|uniref:LysR family transcriptional regulator n=1 Tax=Brevibacterium sp. 2SA TaxID=2502198 RepID=UPI0010F716E8|nr:LysR family transcriptional regulator [Brevibacterium sp. 2SA]